MNKEYIKELLEENKEKFFEAGLDITSPEDLEDMMISYITSNMQYDFNIDVLTNKLFSNETISKDEEIEIDK